MPFCNSVPYFSLFFNTTANVDGWTGNSVAMTEFSLLESFQLCEEVEFFFLKYDCLFFSLSFFSGKRTNDKKCRIFPPRKSIGALLNIQGWQRQ